MWVSATTIDSELTPEEFRRRLADEFRGGRQLFFGRVIGRLRGDKFFARACVLYENPWQTFVHGTIQEHEGRTRVNCRFAMHKVSKLVSLAVLAFVLAMLVSQPASDQPHIGARLLLIMIPILIAVQRYSASREKPAPHQVS